MSVTVTRDNAKNVIAAIQDMAKKHVLVGIPSSENGRNDGPIGNAALGAIHENGSGVRNIPARPFLKPGVAAAADQCVKVLKSAAQNAFTDKNAIDKGLNAAGLIAQASVKKRIVSQEGFTPLKAATLAARKRKGAKGEKALIRTGQLLNSITYVVREK